MDYKDLIDTIRTVISSRDSDCCNCEECIEAIAAIETLLAERDAAVEEFHGRCSRCEHFSSGILEFPCTDCRFEGGPNDHWKWRGPTKGDAQ